MDYLLFSVRKDIFCDLLFNTMVNQCKIPSCRALGSKGFYKFPNHSLAVLNEWKRVCELQPSDKIKPSYKICFRHFERSEFIRYGSLFKIHQEAIPKAGVVTKEFPTESYYEADIAATEECPQEAVETPAFDPNYRCLSFCLQHQGTSKYFTINEGKTVSDLDELIRKIGKCTAPYKIPNLGKSPLPSTPLVKFQLPITNFIEVFCADQPCKERFLAEVSSIDYALLFQERIKNIEKDAEIARLRKQLEKSQKSNLKHQNSKNTYKQKLKKLKAKYANRKAALTKQERHDIVQDALKDIFTPKQIDCFLRGSNWQRGFKWDQEDFTLALTLKCLHKRTYNFLRQKKLLPMPGERTLRKYFENFKMNQGFIDPVAKLLEIMVNNLNDEERAVALSFDEVHVRSDISYDSQEDQILGPHSKANTMIMRGVFKKYKMPIWYRMDTALKKDELFQIIHRLEGLGYHVVSVTSDMGPDNRGLAKELGITPHHSWFPNPARPKANIYYFFDVPHILKLIRNNLLEYGFIVPNEEGKEAPINKSMLKNVFEKIRGEAGHSEITIAHKLNDEKIYEVQGQDKQRVKLAAVLLSETMANAINYFFPDDQNMKVLADFVLATNKWFDVLNSSKKNAKTKEKCAYGEHIVEQTHVLEKFRELILKVQVMNGKQAKLPFQIGAAVSTTSLLHIRTELGIKYGMKSVETVVFNQDVCENTFSRLRLMGGAEARFGSLTYKHRLRDYTLGACKDLSVKTAAVLCDEESTKVLTAELTRDLIEDQVRQPPITMNNANATHDNELNEIFRHASAKKLPTFTLQLDVEEIVELKELDNSHLIEIMPAEHEGFIYVSGWLGRKDAKDLVTDTIFGEENSESFAESQWVNLVKSQKLNVPKTSFLNDLKKMDTLFREFHKDAPGSKKCSFKPHDLLRTPLVVENFYQILKTNFPQYLQYPKLLKRFAKARTMFRMRHLQKLICQKESFRSKITKLSNAY